MTQIDNRRLDLSNYLIHFTKGENEEDENGAYQNLKSIIVNQRLFSNNGDIRGGYNCVCFTEAPIECLKMANGIVCYNGEKRYSNYGIMIPKIDIYNLGGRPAIYTDKEDFDILPEKMKHRFVIFEPLKEIRGTDNKCDFTWEREWRMLGDLDLKTLTNYEIIVPTKSIGEKLKSDAEEETFQLFDDCQNSQVPIIIYDELCNDTCEVHQEECPEPLFIENDCIICMDGTC